MREQCRGEPRYEAISSLRTKERLFRTYQETLAQLEALTRQRSERAQAGYRVSSSACCADTSAHTSPGSKRQANAQSCACQVA